MHIPMTDHERRIASMMTGFGQECPDKPTIPDTKTLTLRALLKLEETLEFLDAAGLQIVFDLPDRHYVADHPSSLVMCGGMKVTARPDAAPDMEGMIDALADDSVVNVGTFLALGVRMTPILEEVDANNLMKVANAKVNDAGKFIKAPNHPPVNLKLALKLQGWKE